MVSRVVSEVALIVGVVLVAMVIAVPVGNYVMNTNRPEHFEGGKYRLEILSVNPKASVNGVPCLVVYVKNLGRTSVPNTTIPGAYPGTCSINPSLEGVFWPAAIVNSSGYFLVNVSQLSYVCRSGSGEELAPGDMWILYYPSLAQEGYKPFAVCVYGPGGAKAFYYYKPSS